MYTHIAAVRALNGDVTVRFFSSPARMDRYVGVEKGMNDKARRIAYGQIPEGMNREDASAAITSQLS